MIKDQEYSYETQVEIVNKIIDLIIQKISTMPNFKRADHLIFDASYSNNKYKYKNVHSCRILCNFNPIYTFEAYEDFMQISRAELKDFLVPIEMGLTVIGADNQYDGEMQLILNIYNLYEHITDKSNNGIQSLIGINKFNL